MKALVFVPGFFLLIGLVHARSLSWYLKKSELKLRELWKRSSLKNELTCPIFFGLINRKTEHKEDEKCQLEYYKCSDDLECGPGLKCCYDGCIRFCTLPLKPKRIEAIDWLKEPKSQRVSGDSWLDLQASAVIQTNTECSTSSFSDFTPLQCPTGYKCIIESEEDKAQHIPNRGQCILFKVSMMNYVEEYNLQGSKTSTQAGCKYQGFSYKHGQYFYKDCNFCFCDNGSMRCQLSSCPGFEESESIDTSKDNDENSLISKIKFIS